MTTTADKAVRLPITVKVTYSYGSYNTAAVLGQRASSTSSAEAAAGRLVDKLTVKFGLQPGQLAAKAIEAKGLRAGASVWQIDVNQGAC